MAGTAYLNLSRTPERTHKPTLLPTPSPTESHTSFLDDGVWGSSIKPTRDWGLTPPTTPDPGQSTKYNDTCSPLAGKSYIVAKGTNQDPFVQQLLQGIKKQILHPGEKWHDGHVSGEITFGQKKLEVFAFNLESPGMTKYPAAKLPGRTPVSEKEREGGLACKRDLSAHEPAQCPTPPEKVESAAGKNVVSFGENAACRLGFGFTFGSVPTALQSTGNQFRADVLSGATCPGAKVLEDKNVDDAGKEKGEDENHIARKEVSKMQQNKTKKTLAEKTAIERNPHGRSNIEDKTTAN